MVRLLRCVARASRYSAVRVSSLRPLVPVQRIAVAHPFQWRYTHSLQTTSMLSTVAPRSGAYDGVDAAIIGVESTEEGPRLVVDSKSLSADRVSALSAQVGKLGFKGKKDAVISIPGSESDPAPVLIMVGLGERKGDFAPETLRRAAGAATRTAGSLELGSVAVLLPTSSAEQLTAVAEGASLGAYAWNRYMSKSTPPVANIQIISEGKEDVVRNAEITARHVKAARDLLNTPPCDLYPESFAEIATAAAKELDDVTVEVWDEKKLREEKMGGLVGVGQGSIRPPRLVKVAYAPGNASKHLAIVGKGVTFDSGGISL